jgi:fumarylacetoacetate (FAA) hydrolase
LLKLATLPGPTPDGRLVVVSRDLTRSIAADDIAPTLLDAIQRWDEAGPDLTERSDRLNTGNDTLDGVTAFESGAALAPLPRAPQWLDGSVFQSHLDLMAKALHPDRPNEPSDVPFVYQGASDDLRGPTDPIAGYHLDEGIDFEGEFGVVVDDVPMRVTGEEALAHVRLLLLINDVSLRKYAGREITVGFGFLNAKPSTAFAPVAVTPDELGDAWRGGRVHLPLRVERSGQWFGHPHGSEMTFHFGELISHAARTRRLSAGTIVGSGTVSNQDRPVGSACIAERRAIEMIESGSPSTRFLANGELVRMEVLDASGSSVFGEIRQPVVVTE